MSYHEEGSPEPDGSQSRSTDFLDGGVPEGGVHFQDRPESDPEQAGGRDTCPLEGEPEGVEDRGPGGAGPARESSPAGGRRKSQRADCCL